MVWGDGTSRGIRERRLTLWWPLCLLPPRVPSFTHPAWSYCLGLSLPHLYPVSHTFSPGPGLQVVFVPLSHSLTLSLEASELNSQTLEPLGVGLSKEPTCQCRRRSFDPWVRKIPWRSEWQPPPVFLPGESVWTRSRAGCSLWCRKESDGS